VSFANHDVSLVAVISDVMRDSRPLVGIGFNSIGRFAQSGILRERMIPRVLDADPDLLCDSAGRIAPAKVAEVAMRDEKPGGHGDRAGAVAALELACWDLLAKSLDQPAYATIAGHFGRVPQLPVTMYAAGGYYYDGASAAQLAAELIGYAQRGFDAYKIKIGGASIAEDQHRVEVALGVASSGAKLCVDANGRFDVDRAVAYGEMLRPYALRWYEEPVDPLDYRALSQVISTYGGAVATGENLFSTIDARNLSRYGGMRPGVDIFQMDAGLSYGLTSYAATIATLEADGFARANAFPHGGHLINLHIASALGLGGCEVYPGVFQPFGGLAPECTLANGFAAPSDAPGFGLEQKRELEPAIRGLLA
jgi:L-alanine-DL-glutamate epimerase-like enolase superfamily enzyme